MSEQNLARIREHLENVLKNFPHAIGIVDEHGRFIRWNRMATRIFGYTLAEIQWKQPLTFILMQMNSGKRSRNFDLRGSLEVVK